MRQTADTTPCLRILGTRGIPAAHGGFETFAERLALFLVARGWRVAVYCQVEGRGPITSEMWRGVERVIVPAAGDGVASTMAFDWRAILHAANAGEPCLTLGYNTAVFCAWLRLRGVPNVINMDGIEWARAKWGLVAKLWFWLNDQAGCRLGDHLVADHPGIAALMHKRVAAHKVTMIPYGADEVFDAPLEPVTSRDLIGGRYLTLVARPEPENSVLEVVRAFSKRPRGVTLVVLGHYRDGCAYHDAVRNAAGPEVKFLGAIYDRDIVQSLRFHSLAYVHGHRVGGTNPSLVESLGAGNAVLAHDNRFNRWVAEGAARYFNDEESFDQLLITLLDDATTLAAMRTAARRRARTAFTWETVLADYENLLARPDMLPRPQLGQGGITAT